MAFTAALDNGKILFNKPVAITNAWTLINDKGYLYFTHPGKFFDMNIPGGIDSPETQTITKIVKEKEWLVKSNHIVDKNGKLKVELAPIPEEMIKDKSTLFCWNSETKRNEPYKIVEKKVLESVKIGSPRKFLTWNYPKPSIDLLFDAIRIATSVYKRLSSEVEIFVLYNNETNDYELLVPTQEVSGATCTFNYTEIPVGKCECVIEIHSHHTMTCSHSGTDDRDDFDPATALHNPHISVVIKGINNFDFTNIDKNLAIRLAFKGKSYSLKAEDIFDTEEIALPQVKKRTPILSNSLSGYNYNDYYSKYSKSKYSKPSKTSMLDDYSNSLFTDYYGEDFWDEPKIEKKASKKNPLLAAKVSNGSKSFDLADLTVDDINEFMETLSASEYNEYYFTYHQDLEEFLIHYFMYHPEKIEDVFSEYSKDE